MTSMIEALHRAIEEFEIVNGIKPNQINITSEAYEHLVEELKPILVMETSSIVSFEGIPLNIED